MFEVDEGLEISIAIWTETEMNMPTVKQLRFVLSLCSTRDGVDESFWERDVITKRDMAAIIHRLSQLPVRYPR